MQRASMVSVEAESTSPGDSGLSFFQTRNVGLHSPVIIEGSKKSLEPIIC
jgi:hypothetical protein